MTRGGGGGVYSQAIMNKKIRMAVTVLVACFALCDSFGNSFVAESADSVVPAGVYSDLYDDRRSNQAVILDEYGMAAGIGSGVSVDYRGSGSSLNEINGVRIYKRNTSISGVGSIFADISVDYEASGGSGNVSGIFLRKASQADGAGVMVENISAVARAAFGSSYGIFNYTSSLGNVEGVSASSKISASGGNESYGIYNIIKSRIGSLGNLEISADGNSVYGIYVQNGSEIGGMSDLKISATAKRDAYGIYFYDSSRIGNLSGVSVSVSGAEAVGISKDDSSSIGELSGVRIYASGAEYAAGIQLGYYSEATTLSFKNSSSVRASSSASYSGGTAYAIASYSSNSLTLKGDSTVHTLEGAVYSVGELIIDGSFALENSAFGVESGMAVKGGSMLSWEGVLKISGGRAEFEDGAKISVKLDVPELLGEYAIISSDSEIAVALSGLDFEIFNSEGELIDGVSLALRERPGGGEMLVAIPEPAAFAAAFGIFAAFAAAVLRRRKRACRSGALGVLALAALLALAGCAGTEAAARGKSASVSVVCRDGFSGARAEIARAERKLVKGGAEFRNPVSVCCIMARTLLEKRLMEPLGEGAETSIAADLGAGGAFRVRISCGGEVFDFEGTENTPEGGDTPKLEGAVKISRNGKSEIRKFDFVVRRDGIAVGDHWIDAGAGK